MTRNLATSWLSSLRIFNLLVTAMASTACYVAPHKVDPVADLPAITSYDDPGQRRTVAVQVLPGLADDAIPEDLFTIGEGDAGTHPSHRLGKTLETAMEEAKVFRVTSGVGSYPEETPDFTFEFSVKAMYEETVDEMPWYRKPLYWTSLQPLRSVVVVRATVLDSEGNKVRDGFEERGEAPQLGKNKEHEMEDLFGMKPSFDKVRTAALANATQKCIHKLIYAAAVAIAPADYAGATND